MDVAHCPLLTDQALGLIALLSDLRELRWLLDHSVFIGPCFPLPASLSIPVYTHSYSHHHFASYLLLWGTQDLKIGSHADSLHHSLPASLALSASWQQPGAGWSGVLGYLLQPSWQQWTNAGSCSGWVYSAQMLMPPTYMHFSRAWDLNKAGSMHMWIEPRPEEYLGTSSCISICVRRTKTLRMLHTLFGCTKPIKALMKMCTRSRKGPGAHKFGCVV